MQISRNLIRLTAFVRAKLSWLALIMVFVCPYSASIPHSGIQTLFLCVCCKRRSRKIVVQFGEQLWTFFQHKKIHKVLFEGFGLVFVRSNYEHSVHEYVYLPIHSSRVCLSQRLVLLLQKIDFPSIDKTKFGDAWLASLPPSVCFASQPNSGTYQVVTGEKRFIDAGAVTNR